MSADGSLEMAGHKLKCENVRTRLDSSLPNLGVAVPDERLLLINPFLVGRQPKVVQLFVFSHECGHHRVGASELGADCWAVNRGVAQGWLDRPALQHVCRSFGNAERTATHPSAKNRCANLERCFGTAIARHQPKQQPPVRTATPAAPARGAVPVVTAPVANAKQNTATATQEPAITSEPRLLWTGAVH